MHALVDCDILCYEMGSAVDTDGFPLDWPLVRARVEMRIQHILAMTEATSWSAFLTSQDGTNFRYNVASIKPYKGHRKNKEKPHWYQAVYDYIKDKPNAVVVHGEEADDAMSKEQWVNLLSCIKTGGHKDLPARVDTVICTRDKDLKMVPGWHYGWPGYNQEEKDPYWITPIEGLRWFYKQLLMGDDADNIPGLYTVGPNSAHLKKVDRCDTEAEMFGVVSDMYEKFFGAYWAFFLKENGRLLWMRTHEDEMWEFPEGWEDAKEQRKRETSREA